MTDGQVSETVEGRSGDGGSPRLASKAALVTGASSGIGAQSAWLLASEGADVALLARGDGLADAAERVRGEGRQAVELRADVGDRDALAVAIEQGARDLGGLDIVVVGAAAGAFGRFEEIPPADFDRCVEVTFRGAVDTIRAVLPHLERSGGRLVVIGSAADALALPLLSPYVAAKHALDGFLHSLRAELRGAGSPVEISVIRPGAVDSPFWRHLTHPAERTPPELPRLATYTTDSVARAVVACAIVPRRSLTIGGQTLALEVANAVARPLVERVLAAASLVLRAGASPDPAPDALWEPAGDGETKGGLGGRPSLLTALRLRGSRPRG